MKSYILLLATSSILNDLNVNFPQNKLVSIFMRASYMSA